MPENNKNDIKTIKRIKKLTLKSEEYQEKIKNKQKKKKKKLSIQKNFNKNEYEFKNGKLIFKYIF